MALAVQTKQLVKPAQSQDSTARRELANGLLSGAVTLTVLLAVLAVLFRLAVGLSPWPYFILALAPFLAAGLLLIELCSPRSR